jgi:hypothetical protein
MDHGYEDLPYLRGRAGHAQFTRLRGAKFIGTLPQRPDTPGGACFGAVDWSLARSVVIARTLEWTSTEECLRRPWCREAELPTVLVKNKVGFASFEAVVSGFSILAQYEITRHGHKRLARLGQSIDLGAIGYSVLHNYRRDGTRW